MIIILFITSHIWHFHVPWFLWIIACFDGIGYFSPPLRKGDKGDKGDKGEKGDDANVILGVRR